MKISDAWLKEKSACDEGIEWFLKHKETEGLDVLKSLIKDDKLQWGNWLICRLMDKPNCIRYAIFAALEVIGIYEKKYPDDKRPRKAIEAAQAWLDNPNDKTKAAASAAASAAYAYAYAYAAAYDAASAAAYDAASAAASAASAAYAYAYAAAYDAAYAAASAAYAAAYDAAYDAASAASAAYAAADAAYAAARKKLQLKILEYGMTLLQPDGEGRK